MAKPIIPERAPIHDEWNGLILQIGESHLFSSTPQPEATVLASGPLIIRYGLRKLGNLNLSIVPGMVVLDYGEILTGVEAWDFLLHHSNPYPRAEVMGYRSDGKDDIFLVKNLDMAVKPQVLVYTDQASVLPIARPTAVIAYENDNLPPSVLEYIPCYPTLADWQTAQSA